MYNRYIRRDDGTYTKVAEPDPPRQETTGPGSQPSPPPPDDPNESGPRSGGPPPSFGGAEGLALTAAFLALMVQRHWHGLVRAVHGRERRALRKEKEK